MSRVAYFAYGSNMQTATLQGRRGIEFFRALPARAAGWRLVLDKPPLIPIGEGFANIVPDHGREVLGVLYEITPAALEHLDLTEGVLIGNYQRIAIPVTPLSSPGATVSAFTLVSDRRDSTLRPSSRYLSCLVAGAEEHRLPASYVALLRAVPARPETAEAAEFWSHVGDSLRRTR